MLEAFFVDFAITENSLAKSSSELERVIDYRQIKYQHTAEYKEVSVQIQELIKKLESTYPEEKKTIGNLEDCILRMECICFSAAYRDGMGDLMTAITLNNENITKVMCYRERKATAQQKEAV